MSLGQARASCRQRLATVECGSGRCLLQILSIIKCRKAESSGNDDSNPLVATISVAAGSIPEKASAAQSISYVPLRRDRGPYLFVLLEIRTELVRHPD